MGTSPMVQWLRICQAMQETPIWSLVSDDSTYSEQLSLYATTTESLHLDPMLCSKRSHHSETPQLKSSLSLPENTCSQQQRPRAAKKKCCAVLGHFSHVWLFGTLRTEAPQAPLSMGILQARILVLVVMPSFKGLALPRDRTHISYISCIGSQVLYR